MHPPQRLHQALHALDIQVQPLHRLGLNFLAGVQEALDQVAVDEAVGLLGLADLVLVGAVLEEGDGAGGVDEGGEVGLEGYEGVEVVGGDEAEEVEGAFDLWRRC